MKELKPYNRDAAAAYAKKWALGRNKEYKDYENWGGDCTNFISQCLKAGDIPFDHSGIDVLSSGIGIVIIVELQRGQLLNLFINI